MPDNRAPGRTIPRLFVLAFISFAAASAPAAAGVITAPGSLTFDFQTGNAGMVSSFGYVNPSGLVVDYSYGNDTLSGPWGWTLTSLNVNLPAGAAIDGITFNISNDLHPEPASTSPNFAVSGSASMTEILVSAYGCAGGLLSTEFSGPFTSNTSFPVAPQCASGSSLSFSPFLSGNGFLSGSALQYPAYDQCCNTTQFFEYDGFLRLTADYSVTVDYTSVPESGELLPLSAVALSLTCIGYAAHRRRTSPRPC